MGTNGTSLGGPAGHGRPARKGLDEACAELCKACRHLPPVTRMSRKDTRVPPGQLEIRPRLGRVSEPQRRGRTHWQGHQDPSKSVSIFLRETEENLKMVFIYGVFISRNRTVVRKVMYNFFFLIKKASYSPVYQKGG